jgi:CIC family chloride channel protein
MPEHQTHRDLRALTVEQAMQRDPFVARLDETVGDVNRKLKDAAARVAPVVDAEGLLTGIVGRRELGGAGAPQTPIAHVVLRDVVTVFPDQSLDLALLKLGRHAVRQAPVVSRLTPGRVIGMLSLEDVSAAVSRS